MNDPENVARKYRRLVSMLREHHALSSCQALLSWDQETCMPPAAIAGRSRQRAALAGVSHQRIIDPEFGDLLAELGEADLDPAGAANVRAAARDRDRAVKVPTDLVTALAEAVSLGQQAWVRAREKADWSGFAPALSELVTLRRREAEAIGYPDEPYDALLDEFEPGMRTADIEPLFASLRRVLVPLVTAIRANPPRDDDDLLRGDFDVAAQERLARRLLTGIGFDLDRGRLDVSAHPFTTGIDPDDVRLTSHYDPRDLGKVLYSTLHEGGHGLYEQGFDPAHTGTPMAEAVSLGIHESQSRLWENMVGRSVGFMNHLLPLLTGAFPDRFAGVDARRLFRAVNVVRPGAVRIDADEVTYNLHIILRTELERSLFRGEIAVDDLPGLWNEKMTGYLGIVPRDDAEGVLQDIHWSCGMFGYFPTYSLGNLYAAQFHARAALDIGDLPERVAAGDFAPLLDWLRKRIHVRGRLLTAGELCREATGEELSIDPFANHLQGKYGELYDLSLPDRRQE